MDESVLPSAPALGPVAVGGGSALRGILQEEDPGTIEQFFRFLSRPGFAFRSLISGDLEGAGRNVAQFANEIPLGGMVSPKLTVTNAIDTFMELIGLGEKIDLPRDLTTQAQRPEFSDVVYRWGGPHPASLGWGEKLGLDVVGGLLTDPLTLVGGLGKGPSAKALAGATRPQQQAMLVKGLRSSALGAEALTAEAARVEAAAAARVAGRAALRGEIDEARHALAIDRVVEQAPEGVAQQILRHNLPVMNAGRPRRTIAQWLDARPVGSAMKGHYVRGIQGRAAENLFKQSVDPGTGLLQAWPGRWQGNLDDVAQGVQGFLDGQLNLAHVDANFSPASVPELAARLQAGQVRSLRLGDGEMVYYTARTEARAREFAGLMERLPDLSIPEMVRLRHLQGTEVGQAIRDVTHRAVMRHVGPLDPAQARAIGEEVAAAAKALAAPEHLGAAVPGEVLDNGVRNLRAKYALEDPEALYSDWIGRKQITKDFWSKAAGATLPGFAFKRLPAHMQETLFGYWTSAKRSFFNKFYAGILRLPGLQQNVEKMYGDFRSAQKNYTQKLQEKILVAFPKTRSREILGEEHMRTEDLWHNFQRAEMGPPEPPPDLPPGEGTLPSGTSPVARKLRNRWDKVDPSQRLSGGGLSEFPDRHAEDVARVGRDFARDGVAESRMAADLEGQAHQAQQQAQAHQGLAYGADQMAASRTRVYAALEQAVRAEGATRNREVMALVNDLENRFGSLIRQTAQLGNLPARLDLDRVLANVPGLPPRPGTPPEEVVRRLVEAVGVENPEELLQSLPSHTLRDLTAALQPDADTTITEIMDLLAVPRRPNLERAVGEFLHQVRMGRDQRAQMVEDIIGLVRTRADLPELRATVGRLLREEGYLAATGRQHSNQAADLYLNSLDLRQLARGHQEQASRRADDAEHLLNQARAMEARADAKVPRNIDPLRDILAFREDMVRRAANRIFTEVEGGAGAAPPELIDQVRTAYDAAHNMFEEIPAAMRYRLKDAHGVPLWKHAEGNPFYIPHQAEARIWELLQNGELDRSAEAYRKIRSVFDGRRDYRTTQEWLEALRGVADEYGLPLAADDTFAVAKTDFYELSLRRMHAFARTNAIAQINDYVRTVGDAHRLPADMLREYTNGLFASAGMRSGTLEKILGGGNFEFILPAGQTSWLTKLNNPLAQVTRGRNSRGQDVIRLKWAGLNSIYKPLLTSAVYNPKFHVRNAMSAVAMGLLDPEVGWAGTRAMWDYVRNGAIVRGFLKMGYTADEVTEAVRYLTDPDPLIRAGALSRLENSGKMVGNYTWGEVAQILRRTLGQRISQADILSTLDEGFFHEGAKAAREAATSEGALNKAAEFFVKFRELGENWANQIEHRFRTHATIELLRKGVPADEVVQRVNRIFVDYSVNSTTERWMRDVFPFARFMVGSSAWLKSMVERPFGTGTTALARLQGSGQSTVAAEGTFVPQRAEGSVALPLPWKDLDGNRQFLVGLGLPHESALKILAVLNPDLSGIRETVGGGLHPTLRVPAEALAGTKFYNGEPWGSNRKATPLSGLAPFAKDVTLPSGKVRREVPGVANELMGVFPTSVLESNLNKLLDEKWSAFSKVVNLTTGVRTLSVDMDEELRRRMQDYLKEKVAAGQAGQLGVFFSRMDPAETPEDLRIVLQEFAKQRAESSKRKRRGFAF